MNPTTSLLLALGYDASDTFGGSRVSLKGATREYAIVVTSARSTLLACHSAPGANDGHEVARRYAAPAEAVASLAALVQVSA